MATWFEIEKQLYKHVRRACSAGAAKVRDELYEEAKTAILDFYVHYEPKYYKRYEWNFKKNSFKKSYSDHGGNSVIYGGIELTPQFLKDLYDDPVQEVFETVFSGYHGIAGRYHVPSGISLIPPRMIPSPKQRLLDKKKKILKNQKHYIAYAKKVAARECPLFVK